MPVTPQERPASPFPTDPAWIILASLLFVLPLAVVPSSANSVQVKETLAWWVSLAAAPALLMQWAFERRRGASGGPPRGDGRGAGALFFIICVAGYAGSWVLSALLSPFPGASGAELPRFLASFALFWLAASVAGGGRDTHFTLSVFLFSSLLAMGSACAQLAGLDLFFSLDLFKGRVFGSMGNPNFLASLIVLVFPLALYGALCPWTQDRFAQVASLDGDRVTKVASPGGGRVTQVTSLGGGRFAQVTSFGGGRFARATSLGVVLLAPPVLYLTGSVSGALGFIASLAVLGIAALAARAGLRRAAVPSTSRAARNQPGGLAVSPASLTDRGRLNGVAVPPASLANRGGLNGVAVPSTRQAGKPATQPGTIAHPTRSTARLRVIGRPNRLSALLELLGLRTRLAGRLGLGAVGLLAIAVLLAATAGWAGLGGRVAEFAPKWFDPSMATGSTNPVANRLNIWTAGIAMIRESPWTGHGPASFELLFPGHRPAAFHIGGYGHSTDHAHNEFLELGDELGIPGLIFFLAAVGAWLALVAAAGGIGPPLAAGMAGFLAQSTFDVSFRFTSWPFFWLALGIGWGISRRSSLSKVVPDAARSGGRALFWGVFLVSAAVLAPFLTTRLRADIRIAGARQAAGVGRTEQAVSLYRSAIATNPRAYSAYYEMAFLLTEKMNRQAEALAAYHALGAIAPDYGQIHYNLGIVEGRLAHKTEARAQLRKAVQLDPFLRDARLQLARADLDAGDAAESRRQLEILVAQNGDDKEAREQLVRWAFERKEWALMIDQCLAIRARLPGDRGNLNNLAVAYGSAGRNDEAFEVFAKLTASDPSDGVAHRNLGIFLLSTHRNAEAAREFQEALRIDPTDATSRAALASVGVSVHDTAATHHDDR